MSDKRKNKINRRSGRKTGNDRLVGEWSITHGMTGTPEYSAWQNMITRCSPSNKAGYHLYGGRGITVCDRWRDSFENFLVDMGNRPSPNHSIDRINVNGNYEKDNCRWATTKEQAENRRTTLLFDYQGEKVSFIRLAELTGVSIRTLQSRHYRAKYKARDAAKGSK
jgi:hypothetical protein